MVSSLSGELEVGLAPRLRDRLPGENLVRGLRVLQPPSTWLGAFTNTLPFVSNIFKSAFVDTYIYIYRLCSHIIVCQWLQP